jgi:hypothetical protein
MAFVKDVGGVEIYNICIQSFVHFYTNFWSYSNSKQCSAKRIVPERCRAAMSRTPRRTVPARRATRWPARRPHPLRAQGLHAARAAPSPNACAPRRLFFSPRHASPAARAMRTRRADRRSVCGPSRRPRPQPYYDSIFTVIRSSRASTHHI